MKKIYKIFLFVEAISLLLLPYLLVDIQKTHAWLEPTWERVKHNLEAADGGEKITDTFVPPNINDVPTGITKNTDGTITMHFTKWLAQDSRTTRPSDQQSGNTTVADSQYSLNTSGQAGTTKYVGMIVYKFDEITTDKNPYYIMVVQGEDVFLNSVGTVKLNSSSRVFSQIGSLSANWMLNSDLNGFQKAYLLEFIGSAFLSGSHNNFDEVKNFSPGVIQPTDYDLNCPEFALSVDYGDTSEFKETDFIDDSEHTQYNRFKNNLPPENAQLRLIWKPFGSPMWQIKPVGDLITINKETNKFNVKINNLKPGQYYLASYWALKRSSENSKWTFDNQGGEHDLWSATIRISWSGVRPMSYYVYGGGSQFTVPKPGTGELPTGVTEGSKDIPCPAVSITRREDLDYSSADNKTCGTPSINIFPWVFCEMAYAIKAFADWAICKSESIFMSMTNMFETGAADIAYKECRVENAADTGESAGTGGTGETGDGGGSGGEEGSAKPLDITVELTFKTESSYKYAVNGLSGQHRTYVYSPDLKTRIDVSELKIISKTSTSNNWEMKMQIKTSAAIPASWDSITVACTKDDSATISIFRFSVNYPASGTIKAVNG